MLGNIEWEERWKDLEVESFFVSDLKIRIAFFWIGQITDSGFTVVSGPKRRVPKKMHHIPSRETWGL